MDENEPTELKPPYFAFKTFLGFLADLTSKPLPPQIDRSIMAGKSGTDQASLFAALKFFGLINGVNVVQPGLTAFKSADEAGRKRAIEAVLRQRYPGQLTVSEQNGTEKLLLDSFEKDFGYTGDTRRKAMTFFLHAARWVGISLSPHFPVTRMGSGTPAAGRAKRTTKKRAGGGGTGTQVALPLSGQGERISVVIGDAGTVEVQVNVRWLDLADETFSDLRRILKELRELGAEPSDGEEDEEVSTS